MIYRLQFGFWGFRINGGFLYGNYRTKEEAEAALYRLTYARMSGKFRSSNE